MTLSISSNNTTFTNSNQQDVPGVIITHSPASTNIFIGSPSIVILPNGNYVASHDYFGKGTTNNQACIYTSQDKGNSWTKLTVLDRQWWSTLFVHNNELYIMGVNRKYGDTVIRRSTDEGKTWTVPNDENTGLLLFGKEYHCSSVPVVVHNGRIWRAMEERNPPEGWGWSLRSFVMSAPVTSNLLKSKNWLSSNQLKYENIWPGKAWLEGNIVVSPKGGVCNVLRHHTEAGGTAIITEISKNGKRTLFNPETGFIKFPGGSKKFTIRYDSISKQYWALSNYVPEKHKNTIAEKIRNTVALISSPDLLKWTIKSIVLFHPDYKKIGFQYADWQFENEDIIFISRTAFMDKYGGAPNNHDANLLTFHRIEKFRSLNLSPAI